MVQAETTHRYPRLTTLLIELLCALTTTLATINIALPLLRFSWQAYGLDRSFLSLPLLPQIVGVITRWSGIPPKTLVDLGQLLLPALGWLAVALLLSLLLRNAFPVVRTSSRGMLVEFMGSWLPIRWENLQAIKVTEDLAAERFVLLAQVDPRALTGWHRCYSVIYNFSGPRAFLVTSNISEFDTLVQTVLSETDRAARAGDAPQAVRLEEEAWSPLFRFLLSPGSFFSRRSQSETDAERRQKASTDDVMRQEVVRGTYPARINALFLWGSVLLIVLAAWRYLGYWGEFIALMLPRSRLYWPFSQILLTASDAQSPWMKLVAAHLLVALIALVVLVLRSLLPAFEVRPEGLRVGVFGRWRDVPWQKVSAIKATEFSEQSQVLLIQMRRAALPARFRVGSLLYDGSFTPGVLITSAISNFEVLLQRTLVQVTKIQPAPPEDSEDEPEPLLQRDSPSWLIWLMFRPSAAIDALVEQARANETLATLQTRPALAAGLRMLLIALPVALLPLFNTIFNQTQPPGIGTLVRIVLLLIVAMLEWPLVALLAPVLDDSTGGGEEGQRPLYLYPTVQLPRALLGLLTLLLVALSVPVFPVLTWLGAMAWTFLLAAGLWESLYTWKGNQLLLGGLAPVAYQLLLSAVVLLALR